MNTRNIYFHGEMIKILKLMMKKKSSGAGFIVCSRSLNNLTLTLIMLWADSADGKLAIFCLENRI